MPPPVTDDGYHWTRSTGMQQGVLRCKGVVDPPSRIDNSFLEYDVVVIGAGYAGLIAARELVQRGELRSLKESFVCLLMSTQAIPLLFSKPETVSEEEPGLPKLMVSHIYAGLEYEQG